MAIQMLCKLGAHVELVCEPGVDKVRHAHSGPLQQQYASAALYTGTIQPQLVTNGQCDYGYTQCTSSQLLMPGWCQYTDKQTMPCAVADWCSDTAGTSSSTRQAIHAEVQF